MIFLEIPLHMYKHFYACFSDNGLKTSLEYQNLITFNLRKYFEEKKQLLMRIHR